MHDYCDVCVSGFVRALDDVKLEERIARSQYHRFWSCKQCVEEIRQGDVEARSCFDRCFPPRKGK